MRADLLLVCQIAIGFIFFRSSLGKLRHPRQFLVGLADYRIIPDWLVDYVGFPLILAETVIALSHLSGLFLVTVVPASMALLTAFAVVVAVTMKRGLTVSCLCFGAGDEQETISIGTIIRIALLLLAEFVLWLGLNSGVQLTKPHDLDARELADAVLNATLILIFAYWLFAARNIVSAQQPCRTCDANATK